MITAIIVDDEERNRSALAKMLDQFCPNVNLLGQADSANSAIELMDRTNPQLLFLDIEMPGGDGFSLLQTFRNPSFQVIFTTAHAAYAIKAIKFAALDYLLKPINLSELKFAVNKAEINAQSQDAERLSERLSILNHNNISLEYSFRKIALPSMDGIEFHAITDILRCEAERAYCKFYLTNKRMVLVSRSLSDYEEILSECNFFRVHKSNMVNIKHIKKYVRGTGGYLILSDDSHVEVASRKKDELMQLLARP